VSSASFKTPHIPLIAYSAAGGRTLVETPNAGGSSGYSEVFAFEQLAACEMAGLLKTETQIVYDTAGKITDILVTIDGKKIGVSVVRAVQFVHDGERHADDHEEARRHPAVVDERLCAGQVGETGTRGHRL
jgi:hypothetical protein